MPVVDLVAERMEAPDGQGFEAQEREHSGMNHAWSSRDWPRATGGHDRRDERP